MERLTRTTKRQTYIAVITLLFLLASILTTYAGASDAGNNFKVKFDVVMFNYNHLGKELSYTYTYNGAEIKSGDIIHVDSSQFTIQTTIIEHDSIDDIGNVSVTFNTSECLSGATKSATTTVYERGGRKYPHASADFTVTYTVSPASANSTSKPSTKPSVGYSVTPSTKPYTPPSIAPTTNTDSGVNHSQPESGRSFWKIFGLSAAFAIFGGGYLVVGAVLIITIPMKKIDKDFGEYFDIPEISLGVIAVASFLLFVLCLYFIDWAYTNLVLFTIIFIVCLAILLCLLITPFGKKVYQKKKQQEEAQRIKDENKRQVLADAHDADDQGLNDKAKELYTEVFTNWTMNELSGMPTDTEIGTDGKPKVIGQSGWGSKYTFYVTRNGYCYHTGSCNKHAYQINAIDVLHKKYSHCSRCHARLPDLSWYDDQIKLSGIKQKYSL